MNLVDVKYISTLSSRLEKFKVKSNVPYRANFRCPLCGDSEKSEYKTRGWIIEKSNSAFYRCFNCGASTNLRGFLRQFDQSLYNEYTTDEFLENKSSRTTVEKPSIQNSNKTTKKVKSPLQKILKISSLKDYSKVKKYLDQRKIPNYQHYRLYYAPKFNEWTNTMIPDKLNTNYDKPRLVIPFLNSEGEMFGFTGRTFQKNDDFRYVTIMLDDSYPKVFGLDQVDFHKKYYITEGPIDSLFLPNSISMAGADLEVNYLENSQNSVWIFDNEPRNKEIVRRLEKYIDKGVGVCIWPNNVIEKDINDMILSGKTRKEVRKTIDDNTYRGIEAKLELSNWRKV